MKIIPALLVSAAIAAIDQLIKLFIRSIPLGVVVFRLPPLLEITHCINTGAAFSLFSGHTALLAVGSAMLIYIITYVFFSSFRLSAAGRAAYAVLLGGGIGNLVDRLLLGGVTDYIRLLFIHFPVFNFADIAITGSAAILMVLMFTDRLEIKAGEE